MSKSKLDILVERRVLTEKYSIASMAIDKLIALHPVGVPFVTDLDSNKLVIFSYPSAKEVDINIITLLKDSTLHRNVIEQVNKQIAHLKTANISGFNKTAKISGFNPTFVQEFNEGYTMFTYKATIGGAAVLHAMITETLMNTLTIEALKIEKAILDFGR